MSAIRIVVAVDEPGLLERLGEQLNSVPDFEFVGGGRSGRDVIGTVERLTPDIVILCADLAGISGLEVLRVIRWCSPKTKVIIWSSAAEESTILEALRLGARGYIVIGDGADKMVKVVRAVQRGEMWAKRRVLARLLQDFVNLASKPLQALDD